MQGQVGQLTFQVMTQFSCPNFEFEIKTRMVTLLTQMGAVQILYEELNIRVIDMDEKE